MDDEEILLLSKKGFNDPEMLPKPRYKYPPIIFLILDSGRLRTIPKRSKIRPVTCPFWIFSLPAAVNKVTEPTSQACVFFTPKCLDSKAAPTGIDSVRSIFTTINGKNPKSKLDTAAA